MTAPIDLLLSAPLAAVERRDGITVSVIHKITVDGVIPRVSACGLSVVPLVDDGTPVPWRSVRTPRGGYWRRCQTCAHKPPLAEGTP